MTSRILKYTLAALTALLLSTSLQAQFYITGDDDGTLEWNQIRTEGYRVIYPKGLDSIARVYAVNLEKCRAFAGGSIGYSPNESYRKPMPVVLHTGSSRNNGLVVWTPRRMELLTCPDAYNPESTIWPLQLTLHESRHVAQMQFTHKGLLKGLGIGFGEFIPAAFSALASSPVYYEGDAVVAETALTPSGRGQTADFLEYFRSSFAEGDKRNYWQWLYGKLNSYTPDYYKIGYVSMAGMRAMFGFDKWPIQPLRKDIAKAFPAIADTLSAIWSKDAASRAPYQNVTSLTPESKTFISYTGTTAIGENLFAIQSGPSQPTRLVRIDKWGNVSDICAFSSETSRLASDNTSLYWSEPVTNIRWSQKSSSDIWYMSRQGKKERLTRGDRLFNPSVSKGDSLLCATRYYENGRSSIVFLHLPLGDEIACLDAPDSLQIVETVWNDGRIYASGVSPAGFAIYSIPEFIPITIPHHFKINHLNSRDGKILFVCDVDGSNQLYALDPETPEKVIRLTSSPEGASDYVWSSDGTALYMSVLSKDGRTICKAASDSLPSRPADLSEKHIYPFVKEISKIERCIPDTTDTEPEVSLPSSYFKADHIFNFHSWAPAYVDIDDIDALSSFNLYQDLGLGATAFFQNHLGTASGSVAWSAWSMDTGWRNRMSAKFKYSGLYPVIEASMYVNDREAEEYRYWLSENKDSLFCRKTDMDSKPLMTGNVKVYVPLNFSSGGWSRGIIPTFYYAFSNDRYSFPPAKTAFINKYCVNVRAYSTMIKAEDAIYPKFGIGTEVGVSGRIGLSGHYGTNLYSQVYGYLPGLLKNHGLRIIATGQTVLGTPYFADPYANTLPRNYPTSGKYASASFAFPLQGKVAVDYSFPFGAAGWSFLCPIAYIKNFECNLHFDTGAYGTSQKLYNTLSSYGGSLSARLGNLLWLPYETNIGVSYNHSYKDFISLYFTIDL